MALTELQIEQLNNSNASMQRAQVGTLLGNLEVGGAGTIRKLSIAANYTDFTDSGGATGTLVLGALPVGAFVICSTVSSLVGFTGNVSATIQIGDADPDRFSTGTPSVFATGAGGVALGIPSGVQYISTAGNATITITASSDWGLVTAGSLIANLYYLL